MTVPLHAVSLGEVQDLQSAVLLRQDCERQMRAALSSSPTPGLVLTHAERWRIRHCIAQLTRALDAEDIALHQISRHRAASHTPNRKETAA
ncbi:hypothetical protein ACM0P6_04105 [Komagataeibacter sucrofermentans]|uniref:Uncharacterized protein n=1 Tax=Komagataeibacter sucrofermentans TaxID=1053551 RepID=A0A318QYZ2_9PROT|nr:hypothetical protein [Komagataeibacter sucrofermentans]PYD78283.1 hypothetical protein CFR77_11445 [Komagataeibacter sucrofermentans]GBQ45942.1 hypothetical protein AA15973_0761 [Komagataeibacter sucrofermentans DSM 15973]